MVQTVCKGYQQATNSSLSGHIYCKARTCNEQRTFPVIAHEMCMFFCHQVSVHNHCHISCCKLADLSHQHLYSVESLNVCLPVSDKIWYPPSRSCLDDFGKSKPEIRPASNVTMVVGSIYRDKIVHTKMHLLSSTLQTCINACFYASLKSYRVLINRVDGTETVNLKMLKGTIFVGYQNRNFLLCAELPNSSNLWFSQNW